MKVMYSVILSVDVRRDDDPDEFRPSLGTWDQTEDDRQYDYEHLEDEWVGGHHRKWCAVVDEDEWAATVNQLCLEADSTETMGAIGTPGGPWVGAWSPAVAFAGMNGTIIDAYVTPFPEDETVEMDEALWDLLRARCLAQWGNGADRKEHAHVLGPVPG